MFQWPITFVLAYIIKKKKPCLLHFSSNSMESEYSSSAICYSSVIETPAADSQDFNSVSAGSPGDSGANQQQFVVSFISFQDSSLDLYPSRQDVSTISSFYSVLLLNFIRVIFFICSVIFNGFSRQNLLLFFFLFGFIFTFSKEHFFLITTKFISALLSM